jgi:nucleoid DNA-binding protein
MKTLTKLSLSNKLAQRMAMEPLQAQCAVDALFKIMRAELIDGNQMCVRGFGTIAPVVRKAKKARIISRNEAITIPEMTKVKLVPSKDLIKRMNAKPYQDIH